MTPDSINPTPRRSRAEVIESLRHEYGDVTFYDSTTVIAGGKKHTVPEGTTYVSGRGRSRRPEMVFSSHYKFSPSGSEENACRRKEAIEELIQQYGEVTFFDSTSVIAGGKKHTVPKGTSYVSGQGRSSRPEMAFSSHYEFSPPGTEENVRRRKEAIEALKQQYGEVTFYDSTTVIAGGKKHQVPEGSVFVSAPSEWCVGPRGGIYKEWYSPASGRSYRQYYR